MLFVEVRVDPDQDRGRQRKPGEKCDLLQMGKKKKKNDVKEKKIPTFSAASPSLKLINILKVISALLHTIGELHNHTNVTSLFSE